MTSDSGWTLGRNPASQLASLTRSNDLYAYAPANAATAYAIDGLNRAVQVAGGTVTYDGNGNLTGDPGAMSGGASATTFAYDSENRLTGASGAHSATLAYDPLDRLYQLTGGGTVTTFLYDGDALVAEYEGSTLLRRHIHWPGADVPVVTWEGAGLTDPRYLHADERGSIVAITDQSGAASVNRYDEYGVPGATNAGRFGYTGQLWLPQLGLYYYKARIYSPYGGRFMQTDPIGYQGGINLYEYADNDPVDRADPSGKAPVVVIPAIPIIVEGVEGAVACLENSACRTIVSTILRQLIIPIVTPTFPPPTLNEGPFETGQGGKIKDQDLNPGRVGDNELDSGIRQLDRSIGRRQLEDSRYPRGNPNGGPGDRRNWNRHQGHQARIQREITLREQLIRRRQRLHDDEPGH